jgi:hypothetical protein
VKITAHEIRLAVMLVEPRLADMPNTLAVLRQYVTESEDRRSALESIQQHGYDDDTPLADICADFDGMREIARLALEGV